MLFWRHTNWRTNVDIYSFWQINWTFLTIWDLWKSRLEYQYAKILKTWTFVNFPWTNYENKRDSNCYELLVLNTTNVKASNMLWSGTPEDSQATKSNIWLTTFFTLLYFSQNIKFPKLIHFWHSPIDLTTLPKCCSEDILIYKQIIIFAKHLNFLNVLRSMRMASGVPICQDSGNSNFCQFSLGKLR